MKTILVADDEEDLRVIVQMTSEDPNHRIVEASDGQAALALTRKERPDLVILDWMMPGMTGIEVVKALRQDPETSHIPVIMLTAKGQAGDQEEGSGAGAFAYLVKPFSPLQLLKKVQEALAS